MDPKQDIFMPVIIRLIKRRDSLREIRRFPAVGIEGWFKVEVIAALGKKVAALQNKGPDLLMDCGIEIELKAATDLNPSYIRNGVLRDNVPCLFLGNGQEPALISRIPGQGIKMLAYNVFSDGTNKWVIGLITPEKTEPI